MILQCLPGHGLISDQKGFNTKRSRKLLYINLNADTTKTSQVDQHKSTKFIIKFFSIYLDCAMFSLCLRQKVVSLKSVTGDVDSSCSY